VQCIVRPVLCSRSKLTWLFGSMAAATLKVPAGSQAQRDDLPHRINPACGIPRFLSRFARRAGLVALRQTFVRRCQGAPPGGKNRQRRPGTGLAVGGAPKLRRAAAIASPLISRFGPRVPDLLVRAKRLFVAAKVVCENARN